MHIAYFQSSLFKLEVKLPIIHARQLRNTLHCIRVVNKTTVLVISNQTPKVQAQPSKCAPAPLTGTGLH